MSDHHFKIISDSEIWQKDQVKLNTVMSQQFCTLAMHITEAEGERKPKTLYVLFSILRHTSQIISQKETIDWWFKGNIEK